jgi:protein tyrosine/serine phosphatase
MKRFLFLSLLLLTACAPDQRGVPPTDDIVNFGRIDDHLLRGAQPDARALASLATKHGVKTIINLQMTDDVWPDEERLARAHGMTYVNFPLPGLRAPTDEQINQVLALIEKSPAPVFVHCEHGADRTGTVIACYRFRHDHWSTEAVLAEADHYGFSPLQVGMRQYIRRFNQ